MIELRKITVKRRDNKILDEVDLLIPKGTTLVVLGPSGAGKSSILKVILGLWKAQSGSVIINGKDMASLTKKQTVEQRKTMSMVFQSNALFDSINVEQNVGYFLREFKSNTKDDIDNRVKECLEFVNLSHAYELYPDELSEGMKKRVALARAIAFNPSILLYDEPTTGLDPVNSQIVVDLIKKINSAGTTSIVVTHILRDAVQLSDNFIFVAKGKIIEAGTFEHLKASQDPIVKNFLQFEGE